MSAAAAERVAPSRLRVRDAFAVGAIGLRSRRLRAALSALGIAIGIASLVAVVGISASSRADLHRAARRPRHEPADDHARASRSSATRRCCRGGAGDAAARRARAVGVGGRAAWTPTVRRTDLVPERVSPAASAITSAELSLLDAVRRHGRAGPLAGRGVGEPAGGRAGRDGGRAARHRPALPRPAGLDRAIAGSRSSASSTRCRWRRSSTPRRSSARGSRPPCWARRATPRASTCAPSPRTSRRCATSRPPRPTRSTRTRCDVSRPSDALEARAAADETLTALLLGLGAVSLVVGGIGIANVMVIAVLERRGEIGLRRALGATRRHVLVQFLLESLYLAGLGGLVGALAGGAVVLVYASSRGWTPDIPPLGVAGGLGAALLIGALAGLYPALRASRQQPATALVAT